MALGPSLDKLGTSALIRRILLAILIVSLTIGAGGSMKSCETGRSKRPRMTPGCY